MKNTKIKIIAVENTAPVIKVAQQVDVLNKRTKQIQARLGVINAEAAKLSAEQHGIDLRRGTLQRQFDAASQP